MKNKNLFLALTIAVLGGLPGQSQAQLQINSGSQYLMNQAKDMSTDFGDFTNIFFFADELSSFDVAKSQRVPFDGNGTRWKAARRSIRIPYCPSRFRMLDFPSTAYVNDPDLKFTIGFVSPRTLRVQMLTTPVEPREESSLMLAGEPGKDNSWKATETPDAVTYANANGSITIEKAPWRIVLRDAKGKVMTQTRTLHDNDSTQAKVIPFNFIKRGSDNSRSINPVFSLAPNEKIFGCGESFGPLDKVGQKVHLFVTDPQGPETDQQYKPIPFFMSNRGATVCLCIPPLRLLAILERPISM